jgi:TonB family protein
MNGILNVTLLTFIFCSILFGQSGNGTGNGNGTGRGNSSEADKPKSDSETLITYLPGKWETYLADDEKIAVLFPKLPLVLEDTSNNCIGENKTNYIAYSTGKVYVLQTVKSVTPNKICDYKREFSAVNFANRLNALGLEASSKPVEKKSGKFKLYEILLSDEVLWLYHDGENDGWYELRVVNSNVSDSFTKTFLESFKFANNQKGISIGEGANSIIGDNSVINEVKVEKTPKVQILDVKPISLKIVFNPRANYTDEARENNVNGVVRLKVTLLANGSVGRISVVSGLPYGMTEQAIVAARKIVFIPQQTGSKNITVTKTFEYRFTLY